MWWEYDELESKAPYDWSPSKRNDHPDDQIDFHIDLGCGTVPKARLGIDRFTNESVDIALDLDTLESKFMWSREPLWRIYNNGTEVGHGESPSEDELLYQCLPFPNESIESIISHHCLEHIGDGFIRLMDECYRILKPGGIFRIIVPCFPSFAAVSDPDHKRYFTPETFNSFIHDADEETPFWTESFSVPYTKCRFKKRALEYTAPEHIVANMFVDIDSLFKKPREIRVSLEK